jgi:hypothetical protein
MCQSESEEGVELFDIAKRMAGLPLNAGSQARLEQAMANLERARRQVRTPVGDGDEHSDELNDGRLLSRSFGHNLVAQDAIWSLFADGAVHYGTIRDHRIEVRTRR